MSIARRAPLAALALLVSCSADLPFPETVVVDVVIPEPPAAWPREALRLELANEDGAGRVTRLRVEAGTTVRLPLGTGGRRAVLVEASLWNRPLRPAGAIWPDDLEVGDDPSYPRLEASWREGWVASVLVRLRALGADQGFDLERLRKEADARLRDPWVIEPEEVALAIASRRFSTNLLERGEARNFFLPEGGPWIPESPCEEAPARTSEGWLATAPPGLHLWYSSAEDLLVELPEEGPPLVVRRPARDRTLYYRAQ